MEQKSPISQSTICNGIFKSFEIPNWLKANTLIVALGAEKANFGILILIPAAFLFMADSLSKSLL